MQKRDLDTCKLIGYLGLPLAGWAAQLHIMGHQMQTIPAVLHAFQETPKHPYLMIGSAVGFGAAILADSMMTEYWDDNYRGAHYARYLRGARIVNKHALKWRVDAANRKYNREQKTKIRPLTIGGVPVPIHLENRNLLVYGSIGSGKSVSFESIAGQIVNRRDKMVCTDPDGSLYSKFGFTGDVILNPFDKRTASWDIFGEIKGPQDFDRVAKSVIPPAAAHESEEWCGFARDILADTMRKLHEQGTPDVDTLVTMLVREDGEVIRQFLANTDSAGYFRKDAERATASVQFLMTTYVRPLRHMTQGQFSLHEWVHNPDAGNLFITWNESQRPAMLPLVSMWIDMICNTILSTGVMTGKRIFMLLDELASLGKLESFEAAATKGRRFGLRIVAGLQDPAQLDALYGTKAADIIEACFRNYLIFGSSNAHIAKRGSEIIGEHEVERWKVTTNATGNGPGHSRYLTHEPEKLILPTEISNLPDLSAYLLFAEEFPCTRIKLKYQPHPVRHQAFIERD